MKFLSTILGFFSVFKREDRFFFFLFHLHDEVPENPVNCLETLCIGAASLFRFLCSRNEVTLRKRANIFTDLSRVSRG